MSYLIIGGGIAGLYCAYVIHKKFGTKNIIIIEKSNRLGGRIDTRNINGTYLEFGAGGISSTHHNVINLVKELGLENKLIEGQDGRSHIEMTTMNLVRERPVQIPTVYLIDRIVDLTKTDFYQIINALTNRLADLDFYAQAVNYSLYRLIEKFYGVDKADKMTYQFGYHDDFHEQNAIDGLLMFEKTFNPNTKFNIMLGGMIQIIDSLKKYLLKNSIEIKLDTECTDIINRNNEFSCVLKNGDKITAKNIILAIPKSNIIKIKYLDTIKNKLDCVVSKPLVRIYAFFPLVNNKVWFDDLNGYITTKTLLSQIIPIDKQKGILMIYCDGPNAKTWHDLHKKNMLRNELIYHLTKLFITRDIPEPIDIHISYYAEATHMWKPSVDSRQVYKDIMQPIKDEPIFIVGETYSLTQQWSEGALQSVNDLLEIIGLNT